MPTLADRAYLLAASYPVDLRILDQLLEDFYKIPGNEGGGNLHVVLEDCNVDDECIVQSRERAIAASDDVGVAIAEVLLKVPYQQRQAMNYMCPCCLKSIPLCRHLTEQAVLVLALPDAAIAVYPNDFLTITGRSGICYNSAVLALAPRNDQQAWTTIDELEKTLVGKCVEGLGAIWGIERFSAQQRIDVGDEIGVLI